MPIHNIINISPEVIAAAVCLILLLCVVSAENHKDRLNLLFMLILASILIVLISKITSWSFERTFYSYTLPILNMVNSFVSLFSYLGMATMNYYIFSYISIKTPQSKNFKQQELEPTKARINVMLSQIQPHFLYNILNTIKALINNNLKTAPTMVGYFDGGVNT